MTLIPVMMMRDPIRRSMLRPRTFSALSLVAAGLLAIAAWEATAGTLGWRAADPRDPDAQPRQVAPAGDLRPAELANIQLFEQAAPSVVHIETTALRRNLFSRSVYEYPQGSGSGFVWDGAGYLVTNFHVVRGSERILVSGDGFTRVEAQVVGADPVTDLAVVKIDPEGRPLPPLPVGGSRDLQVGQNVYAIGNPFGLDHTLTTGIISGLDREILSIAGTPIHGVIQTDAAINPGNSGGPLLDSSGRLIGVNTAIKSPSGASAGVGFAVPVDTVNRVVPQIIANGEPERPTLGIWLAPDRWTYRQGIQGVVISEVRPGGPADQAGLKGLTQDGRGRIRLGDVVHAINGELVRSEEEFVLQLSSYPPGETVTLKVERDGKMRDLDVTLEARQE